MNYQQTIDYLYRALPMFSRIGADAVKKGLDNTLHLCQALDNPQNKFKSIHVAGTNGKGSVSHMLAAILQSTGYKTGLYTSPHLKDFRERIKVDGKLCEESFVIDFVERVKPLIEQIQPSFFEITVAMAFEYFAQQKVDVAVIEVGLGGRLDSTNVITPELSIITNIGWDHMQILGNTLPGIAFEKAGIIKQNVPVVIGETLQETKPVFETVAAEKNAPLFFAEEKRYISDWQYQHHQLIINVTDKQTDERHNYALDLPGIYQTKNILTVLEAVHQLKRQGFLLDDKTIVKALSQVKKLTGLHGRWELIHQHPAVILDVAHNEDGIKQVVEQLELTTYRQLHIITGMVKDKAVDKVLSLLPATAQYYFTRAQIPRALPENELAEMAASLGLKGKTFSDVNSAVHNALQHAHADDLVLVCGSVFLVGEVDL
ncbi:MAG: bifunctional folylpolyglutamate synthase/dihydrofolate synthase [Ilyomonas sp.]